MRGGEGGKLVLEGARLGIGHEGVAGSQILGGVAAAGCALDRDEELVIGVHQRVGQGVVARRFGAKRGVRRAALLDPDEYAGARALAADRFHARQDHSGNLLDGVFQGALRGRKRRSRLQAGGFENTLRGDFMQTVEVDVADADERSLGDAGRRRQRDRRHATRRTAVHSVAAQREENGAGVDGVRSHY